MLTLFVNILTGDEKYSRSNMKNLSQQFQMSLPQKQHSFSAFLIAFPKCA